MSEISHCFTLKFTGIARVLHTPIALSIPTTEKIIQPKHQTRCIWDTGASGTVITQNVVDALGLKPSGMTSVNTASERNKITNTYEVDVLLSDNLVFQTITVTLGVISDGIDCLLGMDIIGTGDLSLTNLNGNTCMSFRYPSAHEIDFIQNPHFGKLKQTPIVAQKRPGQNEPCPCGSGKKYKRCCGQK